MPTVHFFSEDVAFALPKPRKTVTWIKEVIKKERKTLQELNVIFCSDTHLLAINQTYLNHDTFTDIVTFDNSESPDHIEGDIYISLDRVRENALKYERPVFEELYRVIIHGVLHLMGYKDKGNAAKALMRKKEDACLSLPLVPRETYSKNF